MKKIIAIMLMLAMVFSFAACNKQPVVESSSSEETVTTSEETVTTSEEAVTTTSTVTTTSKQPDTTTTTSIRPSTTTTTSKQPDPATTTSKAPATPTYSGTYMEDTTVANATFDYDSLKADLEAYVATAQPTSTSGSTLTFDLSSNFKKYSILGYYAEKGEKMEAKVTTDANKTIKSFECTITAAYKEATFIEEALKRDHDKLEAFCGKAPTIYISLSQGGNPVNYSTLAELPTSRTSKIYNGTSSEFFNLKIEEGSSPIAQITIKTTRDNNYIKKFTSTIKVDY